MLRVVSKKCYYVILKSKDLAVILKINLPSIFRPSVTHPCCLKGMGVRDGREQQGFYIIRSVHFNLIFLFNPVGVLKGKMNVKWGSS